MNSGSKNRDKARMTAARDLREWLSSNRVKYATRETFSKEADYVFYRHLISNVIRHRNRYLFYIEKLTGKPQEKLDHEVLAVLMLGIAQLEPDSRIKEYAAINETVGLIAGLKKGYLKGFINANLRNYLRKRQALEISLQQQPLHIRTSHDKRMVERWIEQFGEAAATKICEANNLPPEVQVLLNPHFPKQKIVEDLSAEGFILADLHPGGFSVENPAGLFENEWLKRGAFIVQNRSFQKIIPSVASVPKSSVWDVCSAPGGKLIHIEWAFGHEIECLFGSDISVQRTLRLNQNLKTVQSRALTAVMNMKEPGLRKQFDLIILDTPCSATGTIRKHPEIKWNRSESDSRNNRQFQIQAMESVQSALKPGGHLLYITCSLEDEENREVVNAFLENHRSGFSLIPMKDLPVDQEDVTVEGFFQAFPSASGTGSFAAMIRKK